MSSTCSLGYQPGKCHDEKCYLCSTRTSTKLNTYKLVCLFLSSLLSPWNQPAIAMPLIPSLVLTQNPLIIICLQIFIFLASHEGEQGDWPGPVAGVDDYLSHSADSKSFYPEIENINLDRAKTFVFRPKLPEYEDCVDPILSWYSATLRPNFSSKPETNDGLLCDTN